MSIIPTFRIKSSDFNTSNLRDLAGSLSQAFSSICASGAVVNYFNINHLQIPIGASNGYVLTSDNTGNATWQTSTSTIDTLTVSDLSLSGLWVGPINPVSLLFTKVGKIVSVASSSISAVTNNAGIITSSTFSITSVFQPSAEYQSSPIYVAVPIYNDSAFQIGMAEFIYTSLSSCQLKFYSSAGGNFSSSGQSGIGNISFTYSTDT